MTPVELLAPTYVNMLGALDAWLARAADARGEEGDALMAVRLAPDMSPLATQIRFSCVQALEGMARLRDEDVPSAVETLLAEGREAGEAPGTLGDARKRIAQTISQVRAMVDNMVPGDDDRPIAHTLPDGMTFDLTAAQYARDWALAQFYFHIMAAYAILRAQGIALGKADYVAHMFAYLRPGTAPEA